MSLRVWHRNRRNSNTSLTSYQSQKQQLLAQEIDLEDNVKGELWPSAFESQSPFTMIVLEVKAKSHFALSRTYKVEMKKHRCPHDNALSLSLKEHVYHEFVVIVEETKGKLLTIRDSSGD